MKTIVFSKAKSFLFWTLLIANFLLGDALEAARTYGVLRVNRVCRVYDGDTFIVDIAEIHPLVGEKIAVRISKIDTPEINDKREEVKKIAIQARDYVAKRLANACTIELINTQRDKYFRILADVFVDGNDLAAELVEQGLAKPYDGGTKPRW